jgi:hypothetical protein
MNSKSMSLGVSLALAVSCAASAQSLITSPSSSATPYIRAVAGGPAVDVVSFLTVGDSVNMRADGVTPYRFAGIPDGMGAYDNGDGTMTLFVAHEHSSTANGVNHAHQPAGVVGGAYVSRWIVNTSAGADFLRVTNGDDLMTSLSVTTAGAGSLTNFNRFCAADLALQSAFYNPASGKGTTEAIFMTGEESGSNGRVIAIGAIERKGYEIPAFNASQGAWETACARPYASDSTVVIATSDGGANRVFLYVGTKQDSGTLMERAGLMNGLAYGIQVQVKGADVTSENRDFCFNTSGSARYSASFVLAPGGTAAGTSFLRPEDGAWDPANPNDFYFVTTDRIDTFEIGGTQVGRSRLFRMRFSDIANPLAGGTIEALLGSTEGQNMADNICVFNDLAGGTRVMIQEDPGNAVHNAKTWLYTVATDSLQLVLESDKARFGDIGIAAVAPFNLDEENSGVIDARDTLGLGWFIGNMQAHYTIPGELVQGGQLYAFFAPQAVGSCMSDLSSPLDGQVSGDDLAILLSNWSNPGRSDINRDGTTDASDLGLLLNSWGSCGQ